MAKRVKVKLSSGEVRALLTSIEVRDAVMDEAEKRVPSGRGYEAVRGTGGNRAHAFIGATTWGAYNDNARNATLLKALDGG